MTFEELGWTADFSEFRKKIEPVFGPLERLAKSAPDLYAHQVLSHGFMEYSGVTGLVIEIKKQIIRERILGDDKEYKKYKRFLKEKDLPPKLHYKIFEENEKRIDELLKQEYLKWARQNNLPEEVLESGLQEYLND